MARKAFAITDGKGFHIKFASGFTVSVQFGPGNYCDHHDGDLGFEGRAEAGKLGSNQAEVAIIDPAGQLLDLPTGDSVRGYVNADDVLHYINAAATTDPIAYLSEHVPADVEA